MDIDKLRAEIAVQMRLAGGLCFGYCNARTADHVEREIIPEEAATIVRIFEEIAQGRGFARVAKGLNADAVPCPRGRLWAMSCVREMVFRALYRGRIVYGKTTWQYRKGRKYKVRVPASEWITVDKPELRVVPEELWQAAHERLERTRRAYLRQTGGKVWGRPETGTESHYLMSGFAQCGLCGGGMDVIRRTGKRMAPKFYLTCHNGRVNVNGRHPCVNKFSIPLADIDQAVLEMFRDDVLSLDTIEGVITRAVELYRAHPDKYAERRQNLTSEAQPAEGRDWTAHRGYRHRRPDVIASGGTESQGTTARRRHGPARAPGRTGQGAGVG